MLALLYPLDEKDTKNNQLSVLNEASSRIFSSQFPVCPKSHQSDLASEAVFFSAFSRC